MKENTVHKADKGQEIGIKIINFTKVITGDLLETYHIGK